MAHLPKGQGVVPLPPFLDWLSTNIPAVYDNTMSYYDELTSLIKYLQDTVIPALNADSEAITVISNAMEQLQSYVDHYFDNLDVQEEINNKLDEMVEDGTFERILSEYFSKLDDFSDSNTITLGDNLLTNDSLWVLNSGWTTDGNVAFTHIVNQTGDLEYNYSFAANKVYVVDFQVNTSYPAGSDNAGNDFTVVIGNTQPIVTYRGGGSMHYTIALKPTSAGSLKFKCVKHQDPYTASGAFDGTISNITLKEASGSLTQLPIKDADDNTSLAFSILTSDNESVVIGTDAGTSNINQFRNIYIGSDSGKNDVTGYFNAGIGSFTLENSINSSRNTAIGYSALRSMESGDRNTAIGTFAMSGNKYGRKNIAIGFDTMMSLQTGEDNMAIGNQSLITATNVKNQIAIGSQAMGGSTHSGDTPNIAIGKVAMYYNTTGSSNIALGGNALYKNTEGSNNIGIGMSALSQNQTSNDNIAIGTSALGGYALTGSYNIAIGKSAGYYTTSGFANIALGDNANYKVTTGSNNVALGNNALNANQTISGLIGIGGNAGNKITAGGYSVIIGSDMSQNNLTTASRSTAIGSVNLSNMTSLTNSCILGYNIAADAEHTALQNVIAINTGRRAMTISKDNYINIANTIYADTYTVGGEKVGIGVDTPTARLHLPAGTASGGTAPLKLASGTLMSTAEDGAFEYDGTHLYFTVGSTRNTII